MKAVFREYGSTLIAAIVAGLLIFLVCCVPAAGTKGLASAAGTAFVGQKQILQRTSGQTSFDACWSGQ